MVLWWAKQIPGAAKQGLYQRPTERLFHRYLESNHFSRVAVRLPEPFYANIQQKRRTHSTEPTVVILQWRWRPYQVPGQRPPAVGGRPRRRSWAAAVRRRQHEGRRG